MCPKMRATDAEVKAGALQPDRLQQFVDSFDASGCEFQPVAARQTGYIATQSHHNCFKLPLRDALSSCRAMCRAR